MDYSHIHRPKNWSSIWRQKYWFDIRECNKRMWKTIIQNKSYFSILLCHIVIKFLQKFNKYVTFHPWSLIVSVNDWKAFLPSKTVRFFRFSDNNWLQFFIACHISTNENRNSFFNFLPCFEYFAFDFIGLIRENAPKQTKLIAIENVFRFIIFDQFGSLVLIQSLVIFSDTPSDSPWNVSKITAFLDLKRSKKPLEQLKSM